MSVLLAPGTWLKDKKGKDLAGPGDTVTLPAEEEAALMLTGSAVPVEPPAKKKEK
jgi:hypothetical protein